MSGQIKILLVDDETDFTQPMAFWLKSKGYAVTAVSSGEDAIKKVEEDTPDVIFLDLNMPVMDGVEVLKKIRGFNKDVPVIIVSAYVEDLRIKEAVNYEISGVFYKGKDFTESHSLIEAALRTHKKLKK
jgi:two-component system response regulator VicR